MGQNVPELDNTRLKSLRNYGAAIAQALALVADPTGDRGVKVPATNAVVRDFAGISIRPIATPVSPATAVDCEIAIIAGDSAPATASGTVTKGDRVYIDTTGGKEGRLKSYGGFGVSGAQFCVGIAETSAVDGDLFEVRIAPQMVGDGVSAGVATLVGGTVTVTGVTLTANSRVFVSRKTAAGTAGTGGLYAPSANRNVGASTMELRACDLAGALVATDTSVVDWMIVG